MERAVLLTCLLAACITAGVCYPTGAPACLMTHPHHGFNGQQGVAPFSIRLSSPAYTTRQRINIVVSASDGRAFKGIILSVHRHPSSLNTEEFLGTFVEYPEDKLKVISCLAGSQSPVTHKNHDPVTSVNVTWMAPEVNVGEIIFQATIVQNFTTFWYGIKQSLTSDASETLTHPAYTIPEVQTMLNTVGWKSCGKTKGCFMFPDTCSGVDCMAAVTYYKQAGNIAIELFAMTDGYISLGFSDDKLMGNEETMSCVYDGTRLEIQHGYNPVQYNLRRYTKYIENVAGKVEDGKMFCRFTRPQVTNLTTTDNTTMTTDLGKEWYLMIAWGHTPPGAAAIEKHEHAPVISGVKVKLTSMNLVRISTSDANVLNISTLLALFSVYYTSMHSLL